MKMKKFIKKIYNKMYATIWVILFFSLFIFLFVELFKNSRDFDTEIILPLLVIVLTLPNIAETIVKEIRHEKKILKVSCKCPNCRHLVQLEMEEEEE